MNPFAIGNLAVYHGKGVGLITGLNTVDPKGNPCLICKLTLKKSVAQVRVDHPSQTTIRTIMNDDELEDVYGFTDARCQTQHHNMESKIPWIHSKYQLGYPKRNRFCIERSRVVEHP